MARGECLGAECRRKTQQAAKSRGEEQASVDPRISEWGNLHGAVREPFIRRQLGEVKHLSNRRKRNRKRYPK